MANNESKVGKKEETDDVTIEEEHTSPEKVSFNVVTTTTTTIKKRVAFAETNPPPISPMYYAPTNSLISSPKSVDSQDEYTDNEEDETIMSEEEEEDDNDHDRRKKKQPTTSSSISIMPSETVESEMMIPDDESEASLIVLMRYMGCGPIKYMDSPTLRSQQLKHKPQDIQYGNDTTDDNSLLSDDDTFVTLEHHEIEEIKTSWSKNEGNDDDDGGGGEEVGLYQFENIMKGMFASSTSSPRSSLPTTPRSPAAQAMRVLTSPRSSLPELMSILTSPGEQSESMSILSDAAQMGDLVSSPGAAVVVSAQRHIENLALSPGQLSDGRPPRATITGLLVEADEILSNREQQQQQQHIQNLKIPPPLKSPAPKSPHLVTNSPTSDEVYQAMAKVDAYRKALEHVRSVRENLGLSPRSNALEVESMRVALPSSPVVSHSPTTAEVFQAIAKVAEYKKPLADAKAVGSAAEVGTSTPTAVSETNEVKSVLPSGPSIPSLLPEKDTSSDAAVPIVADEINKDVSVNMKTAPTDEKGDISSPTVADELNKAATQDTSSSEKETSEKETNSDVSFPIVAVDAATSDATQVSVKIEKSSSTRSDKENSAISSSSSRIESSSDANKTVAATAINSSQHDATLQRVKDVDEVLMNTRERLEKRQFNTSSPPPPPPIVTDLSPLIEQKVMTLNTDVNISTALSPISLASIGSTSPRTLDDLLKAKKNRDVSSGNTALLAAAAKLAPPRALSASSTPTNLGTGVVGGKKSIVEELEEMRSKQREELDARKARQKEEEVQSSVC